MPDALAVVSTVLGIVAVVGSTLAALVKWVLLPYLRIELIEPVQHTRRQVSENHHSNDEPTVLDRLDDVQKTAEAARGVAEEGRDAARAVSDRLNAHLELASQQDDAARREAVAMWDAIRAIAEARPPGDAA